MKARIKILRILFLPVILLTAINLTNAQSGQNSSPNKKLFDELVYKDSLLFNAVFNTCNMKQIETVLAEDFEFYPDKGELIPVTNQKRAEFIENIKKNFCDNKDGLKMRREVEPGSLQVYLLNDHEVLQTGIQQFYMLVPKQKDKLVEASKFTRTWQKKDGDWRLSKEFDATVNAYVNQQSDELYRIILHEDSILFNAYNAHDVTKLKKSFAEDLEFYHDKDGLTDYTHNMEAFKDNFAKNKDIRRELIPGSLEVYPINNYGAIEIGAHKFCHIENGKKDCGSFKFVMLWKKTNGEWKITRVISYGH